MFLARIAKAYFLMSYYLYIDREAKGRELSREVLEKRRQHSWLVTLLMFHAARRLIERGVSVADLVKVIELGLLHDIGYSPRLGYLRPTSQETESCHGLLGGEELIKLGYSEFALPVFSHGTTLEEVMRDTQEKLEEKERQQFIPESFAGQVSRDELVLWAEMHTALNQVVTYKGRMMELRERLAGVPAKLAEVESASARWDPIMAKLDRLMGIEDETAKIKFLREVQLSVH